jgi:hypothetical protein
MAVTKFSNSLIVKGLKYKNFRTDNDLFLATGGTITSFVSGGVTYKVHRFNSSGTFGVVAGTANVEYILVAGGGSGGRRGNGGGGGGGAGGLKVGTMSGLSIGNYTVVIGAGGSPRGTDGGGNNGNNSTFHTINTRGGGGGGASGVTGSTTGASGATGSASG